MEAVSSAIIFSLWASRNRPCRLVQEGIDWLDARCAQTKDYFSKANLMNSKARLLTKIGDTLGADKAKMEEEKYNKEGEKRSGGKAVRAIRMN